MSGPLFIVFSNLGLGGIQRKIVDFVNLLASTQPSLRILIILRKKESFDISDEIKNTNVRILNYQQWPTRKIPFFFTFFVFYHVARLKPNKILCFLSPFALPSIATKLLLPWRHIRVVINEDHYTSDIVPLYNYPQFNHLGIKLLYPFADVIISPTYSAKMDLINTYKVPEKIIRVVPNWTKLTSIVVPRLTKKFDLVYAGRLTAIKHVDFLIQIVAQLKKRYKTIRLLVVGDGDEKVKLERLTNRLALTNHVLFTGPVKHVEHIVSRAKVFVCASKYGAEGFPLAILEAMACGVPVVSRNFYGADEVIKEQENGFLFDTMEECKKKIEALLASPALQTHVARKAKEYVKKNHSLRNIHEYFQALHYFL